jgi:class 3 adenylate cyclase
VRCRQCDAIPRAGVHAFGWRCWHSEDLKDLGVGIVGHRRKLLDAIATLRADANTKAPSPDVLAQTERTPKEAERRQVTVMFSDLVGSTALAARMDPEDLREVIAGYHKCVADIVRPFDGFVAQYLDDGALAYFAIRKPTRTTPS